MLVHPLPCWEEFQQCFAFWQQECAAFHPQEHLRGRPLVHGQKTRPKFSIQCKPKIFDLALCWPVWASWTVKLKHEVSARKLSEHVCLKYHVCCHVKDWLKRRCRWERIILIIEHVCFIRCDWKFMTVRASWEGEGRVCVCGGEKINMHQ